MSNGSDDPVIVCCILGLCCPAASAEQLAETAKMIRQRHKHLKPEQAEKLARKFLDKHDYFRDAVETFDA